MNNNNAGAGDFVVPPAQEEAEDDDMDMEEDDDDEEDEEEEQEDDDDDDNNGDDNVLEGGVADPNPNQEGQEARKASSADIVRISSCLDCIVTASAATIKRSRISYFSHKLSPFGLFQYLDTLFNMHRTVW